MIGYIYALKSKNNENVYIGSTKQKLKNRLNNHIQSYKRYTIGRNHYITSFEVLKHNDCFIELLDELEFNDIKELLKLEGQYIKNHINVINKCIAGRDYLEWYKDNRQKKIDKQTEYYITNKIKIINKRKIKTTCPYCLKSIRKDRLNKHCQTNLCNKYKALAIIFYYFFSKL